MAKADGLTGMIGSVQNLSFYKRKDMDGIIVRSKGGATKKRIKSGASFEPTRQLNKEWSGCCMMVSAIRDAIHPMKPMADYNFTSSLTAIIKRVQLLDTQNARGKRAIQVAQYGTLLSGFSLCQRQLFESVVRTPIQYNIDATTSSAEVVLPEIIPGINLYNFKQLPYYRFTVSLGVVSDITFNETLQRYETVHQSFQEGCVHASSPWHSSFETSAEQTISVNYGKSTPIKEQQLLLLGIGIEFGMPITDQITEPVKYAGSAKIVAVVKK